VEVCAGSDFALARAEDGNVYSWGGLGEGPLGLTTKNPIGGAGGGKSQDELDEIIVSKKKQLAGERDTFLFPQLLESLQGEGIVSICCGANHAGALSDGGDCYMWGDGTRGQLGTGKFEVERTPVMVDSFQSGKIVCQLVVGQTHTLALLDDKSLWSWGFANSGKLGLGISERQGVKPPLNGYFPEPCRVATLANKKVHKIACSANHCAAVTDDGLYTWGSGDGGRLGHGDHGDRTVPTLVQDLVGSTIIDVSLGFWHSAAVVQIPPVHYGGWLFTWGSGYHGQLAQDKINCATRPAFSQVFLDMHLQLVKVSCGPTHCYVMTTDGDLYSWGSCASGELARADIEEHENFTCIPGGVEGFNTMVDRVGRGTVVSFACGNQFTVVATAKYMGPSEEEIKHMEEDEAIRKAEEMHRKREEDRDRRRRAKEELAEQKRAELVRMNHNKPRCDLCEKCTGFEANVFKPNVCKECGHQRARHTIEDLAIDDDDDEDSDLAARKR
jgi:alpha-tubulin suppressor-like RCC1 family protein